ncbi:hypothetical protein JAAARDRAFT_135788 [Jaapia argillacea MUCL 33604]|uniref:DUF6699 domain-containing protein n=1 Tax=Jaapia argillacea MUCL 33604 TaxID=933084 RepID=A0A067PKD7_9AGAM|nr:hypothetical protein JAAARDRAFT_135788 [Jaapia argillacea MUCL 33604]
MDWDVVCAPGEESIRIPSGKRGEWTHIAPHVLMEPATYPALPSMTILCNRLPWQIRITPLSSSHYRPNFVTLSDVVTTLYTTLRTPVSSAEFGSLPHAEQRYVSDAFTERWKSVGGGHREKEREKAKGIKRVDWFCGRTGFDGLDRMSGGGEKWVLRVGGGG